jgi:hypothetical protein
MREMSKHEAIIDVTADYNISSIFSIGGVMPHGFFEHRVRKPSPLK